MKQRYLSLDVLRGLTIFGMVFSAIIPYGVLPAWMYHIQNPPPTHELNMSVPGMSWVDLVFPIFIFCMGAAIPLAGKKRTGQILERFVMLWAFSYLYVFMLFTDIQSIWAQLLTLAGFAALFPLYMVLDKGISPQRKRTIRLIGVIATLAVCVAGHFIFSEVISVQRRGIIIFLLAFLYLFGSLIWKFTAGKPYIRVAIFAVILAFTIISQQLGWPASTYANPNIRWWFNLEYIYFLLLLLPATFVGDSLKKRIDEGQTDLFVEMKPLQKIFSLMASIYFLPLICFLLHVSRSGVSLIGDIDGILSAICTIAIFLNLAWMVPQYKKQFLMIAALLTAGLILEPLTGGIKKVPCTISYCFITCAVSMMLLFIIDYICHLTSRNAFVWIFSGAGKNPLMSYIAYSSLIVPIMNITGLTVVYQMCRPAAHPWIGVLTSAITVLLTMSAVAWFSAKKIFWKA